MSRTVLALSVAVAAAVSGVSTAAFAQQPGAGPPMPLAVDIAKVPVGSWAEYEVTMGTMPPMKSRMALVVRNATGTTVETTVEGGMMAMIGGKMVMAVVMPPGSEGGKVSKMIMQMGNNDPMEMKFTADQEKPFTKPDPKKLVGSEKITVKAGSFKTKHYRDKSPTGDTLDFWVSDSVAPIGLVKLEGEQKSNPAVKGPIKFELSATGKDAKQQITKPAKPFDQAAFMKQATGGAGGPPPGAGAPPPAAPPAAPPKK